MKIVNEKEIKKTVVKITNLKLILWEYKQNWQNTILIKKTGGKLKPSKWEMIKESLKETT